MSKKKVLYHSDFSLLNSGFGKAARLVLSHLYKTGKYDITHLCCGVSAEANHFDRLPWKSIGALPDAITQSKMGKDPKVAQMASYGAFTIDAVMKEEKPDVYIGVQDIWGCDFTIDKSWFTRPNMAIWTTLDSLPILPTAVTAASKTHNFWCWSDFATKSLHKLGHDHVRTMRGPLDVNNFHKEDENIRQSTRQVFNIPQDDFIIGFVFRNQLRKSVPNLLEGYKAFLDNNPKAKGKTKLLLHTNFSEGWGIHKLADELGVDKTEILTTYVCARCTSFGVHVFQGQEQKCPYCNADKSYNTTGIGQGVSEEQLNRVYNLMDVYCHPFTSGGQEIPIQEAKLAELVTLVTNYSCGEDNCEEGSGSLPLDWSEYREHGTEFIKASTDPKSIAKQLQKVFEMSPSEKEEMGKKARQWVIDNFSIEIIGKQLEDFIDNAPEINKEEVYKIKQTKNPDAKIEDGLETKDWLIEMYDKILDMKVVEEDEGHKYWMKRIKEKGDKKSAIEKYFRQTATQDILKEEKENELSKKVDTKKNILYVIPETIGDVFLSTSLFKCLNDEYPDHKLYVATKPDYHEMLLGNEYVYKVLDYDPSKMEQTDTLQGWSNRMGAKDQESYFDIVFLAHGAAQRYSTYTHNANDKLAFDIKC